MALHGGGRFFVMAFVLSSVVAQNDREVFCPPPNLTDAYILTPDAVEPKLKYKPGEKAKIECFDFFIRHGALDLHCGQDGRWIENPPYCEEIKCDPLPDLPNGTIVPKNTVLPGTYVNVSCNTGYLLIGSDRIKCNEDGNFEPHLMLFCQEIRCPDLLKILDGTYSPEEPKVLDTVSFECADGFNRKGPSNITCMKNGNWEPNVMPYCEAIRCPLLPQLKNGNIDPSGTALLDYRVRVSCNEGFEVIGANTLYCSPRGSWEPPEMPVCRKVDLNTTTSDDGNLGIGWIILIVFVCTIVLVGVLGGVGRWWWKKSHNRSTLLQNRSRQSLQNSSRRLQNSSGQSQNISRQTPTVAPESELLPIDFIHNVHDTKGYNHSRVSKDGDQEEEAKLLQTENNDSGIEKLEAKANQIKTENTGNNIYGKQEEANIEGTGNTGNNIYGKQEEANIEGTGNTDNIEGKQEEANIEGTGNTDNFEGKQEEGTGNSDNIEGIQEEANIEGTGNTDNNIEGKQEEANIGTLPNPMLY